MKIIAFFLRHSRKVVLLSVAAGAFSGMCNAALLAVINSVLKTWPASLGLVWSFAGLCMLLPIARFTSESLLVKLGEEAVHKLRMQLCRQILAAPLLHQEQLGGPRLLATLTDDVPSITNAVSVIPLLCVNAALVIGCLIYMGILSWGELLIILAFMVLGIATYQAPMIKVEKIFRVAREYADTLQGHFRALTHGAKELKIHNERRHAFIREGLEETAVALQEHNVAGMKLFTAAASWGQVLVFIVVGLILFVFPLMHNLDRAMLTGYVLTLLYLMNPLQSIMNVLPQLTRANVALKKVNDLGFTLASQGSENVEEGQFLTDKWVKLQLSSVTHRYRRDGEASDFVLGPLDLTFKPGEMVFIVGGNGSGKTTFVKLLAGLYVPESGTIYLNDEPIGPDNKEAYRQHFSVIFSDFYLFETMLGLVDDGLDQRASEYLQRLKLAHKVQIEKGKLSTTDLSQGQRKRLALLTAFLEDRPIYIFDEWAADQDPYFKDVFYMHLLPDLTARHKTVFVITHDDRYYHLAGRIITLENGQMISDTAKDSSIPDTENRADYFHSLSSIHRG
ncbi:MAG TPA: cyclic peptide export ABC transporter [Candidatus Angelobacter sp.]|jgi:putative ATP-binding cassette transporter|nr:cyclic peptide export ABC transporter [Candidatus Angelobacter sp.]